MKPLVRRLHTRMVWLPLSLFVSDAALCLLWFLTKQAVWGRLEIYFLTAALITGWLSFITGLLSLIVLRQNPLAVGLGSLHGFFTGLALMVSNLLWFEPWHALPQLTPATPVSLILRGVALLFFGTAVFVARGYLRRHTA